MMENEVVDLKLSAHLLKLMLDEKIPFEKKKSKADYLIRIGADVEAKDNMGWSALEYAHSLVYVKMVDVLEKEIEKKRKNNDATLGFVGDKFEM